MSTDCTRNDDDKKKDNILSPPSAHHRPFADTFDRNKCARKCVEDIDHVLTQVSKLEVHECSKVRKDFFSSDREKGLNSSMSMRLSQPENKQAAELTRTGWKPKNQDYSLHP